MDQIAVQCVGGRNILGNKSGVSRLISSYMGHGGYQSTQTLAASFSTFTAFGPNVEHIFMDGRLEISCLLSELFRLTAGCN